MFGHIGRRLPGATSLVLPAATARTWTIATWAGRGDLLSEAVEQLSDVGEIFWLVWLDTDDHLPAVTVAEADDLVSSRQCLNSRYGRVCFASETRHLCSSRGVVDRRIPRLMNNRGRPFARLARWSAAKLGWLPYQLGRVQVVVRIAIVGGVAENRRRRSEGEPCCEVRVLR